MFGLIRFICPTSQYRGKHIVLADLKLDNAQATAKILSEAGCEVSTSVVDVALCESIQQLVGITTAQGEIFCLNLSF
ncbi:hypothetical protein [Acinetobacter sp. ANC 4641]|uniref:hypothetical protein n=1 Tax=Acinetobacter sp. ANC 4641 TaxID=2529847 RepID=UPI001039A4AF|nr:hypothetical protein [Acinetobacter sp. ANC 4641]TCB12316.1 hypothetical protein E0H78_03730 [Acinetobacter sp. ANC 4641]